MNNFTFHIPTDIRFGKDQVQCLPAELAKYGNRVLLVYGGGSIKRSGLYDKIRELLADFEISELPGIEPNPKLTSVVKDRGLVKKALPVAVVLTICATGSEMNSGAVISNEKTREKLEINHPLLYPVLSICDPTYLYTLPSKQTAAGAVDILSHVMEQYFQPNDEAYITDVLSEAVMKTVIKYARKAMDEPENYEARSNLMWSSTVALNHLLTVGKGGAWSVHPIEHVISAYYDITHGVGLAVLTPAWMSYVLSDTTAPRFARFAREVFGVEEADNRKAAELGIQRVRAFNQSLGMPATLSGAGVPEDLFDEMAAEAVRTSGIASRAYIKLDVSDVKQILLSCR